MLDKDSFRPTTSELQPGDYNLQRKYLLLLRLLFHCFSFPRRHQIATSLFSFNTFRIAFVTASHPSLLNGTTLSFPFAVIMPLEYGFILVAQDVIPTTLVHAAPRSGLRNDVSQKLEPTTTSKMCGIRTKRE